MGGNMARRLKDCGYHLSAVFDTVSELSSALAEELSTTAAPDLASVTKDSDIIITVVTDDTAMRNIFTSENLLSHADGRLFLNCATLSPQVHEDIEDLCQSVGASALEASMTSSITQAREGTLYLMVGGDQEKFDEVKPLLDDLSISLRYIGKIGQASRVKALVNMVMNMNTAALAEGLGLGDAMGLDLKMLCDVFSQTGANSRVLETDAEDMLLRDHECYFSAAHAAKDSGIANTLAQSCGVKVPLSEATENQYRQLMERGRGDLDKSAIAELTFKGRLYDA